MNFNTIFYRFGLNPNDFINEEVEPIVSNDGFIYEVRQRTDIRVCPHCGSKKAFINGYYYSYINCSETNHIKDVLRIKKARFKCKGCNKSYTPLISGIDAYSKTSNQTINMIVKDFRSMITFKDIAIKYGLTLARVIQIFDEKIPFVPRRTLPFALCIDEIRFNAEMNQKYCCVLYDHDRREIVDIIKNRQLAYLEEYFNKIKENERNLTKYFISDMYDGYKTIRRKFFPKAIHIVDLFHVINQLTLAVNKLRIIAMKKLNEDSIDYRFMKSHWKYFLCRRENIPDKFYTSRKTGEIFHYDDLVFKCVLKDEYLLEGYNALQDLFHYNQYFFNFSDAFKFVNAMADRLILSGNELLEDVGHTYRKWAPEIANGLAKSQNGKHYTNGIAEALNNILKTIKKLAYGYRNFERFRKRAMLIITYKKDS